MRRGNDKLFDIFALAFRNPPVIAVDIIDEPVDFGFWFLGASGLEAVQEIEGEKADEKSECHPIEEGLIFGHGRAPHRCC